jgi:hypothetical protein
MRVHVLKTDTETFRATVTGHKTCEVRRNDRKYKIGDRLMLRETKSSGKEMAAGAPLEYTGWVVSTIITHVLEGVEYGIPQGVCVLSHGEARGNFNGR